MLTLKYIRENREKAIQDLAKKNFDASEILDNVIHKDELRKKTQTELDQTLAESNQLAKLIGGFYKNGETEKAEQAKNKLLNSKLKARLLMNC